MPTFRKKSSQSDVDTRPDVNGVNASAQETESGIDEVMKKYDKESNTRVWVGRPKTVISGLCQEL